MESARKEQPRARLRGRLALGPRGYDLARPKLPPGRRRREPRFVEPLSGEQFGMEPLIESTCFGDRVEHQSTDELLLFFAAPPAFFQFDRLTHRPGFGLDRQVGSVRAEFRAVAGQARRAGHSRAVRPWGQPTSPGVGDHGHHPGRRLGAELVRSGVQPVDHRSLAVGHDRFEEGARRPRHFQQPRKTLAPPPETASTSRVGRLWIPSINRLPWSILIPFLRFHLPPPGAAPTERCARSGSGDGAMQSPLLR